MSGESLMQVLPVILSGGSGTRLWPLSREEHPKQFLSLPGCRESLLQATLLRLSGGEPDHSPSVLDPLIICNEGQRFLVAEQIAQLGLKPRAIVLEPIGRNTAAAVALAALQAIEGSTEGAQTTDVDPILLVLPADHVILDADGHFRRQIAAASEWAEREHLVTFGIPPSAPETRFGYILPGDVPVAADIYPIRVFEEKPVRERALELLADGRCYWNSGIFLFKASTYLTALKLYAPDIFEVCSDAWQARKRDQDFVRPDPDLFAKCRSESIDVAVMEKTDRALVSPLAIAWSDVGSWSALHDTLPKDLLGNVLQGDVVAADTSDTLVMAQSRLVVTLGLRDHLVIETKDAVLVARRDSDQEVKEIVSQLKAAGRSESVIPREVSRPWGSFDSLERGQGFQVKKLSLKPGAAISLQRHRQRAEHWIVVSGLARVTRGEEVFMLRENESTFIPQGTVHRLENAGDERLEVIEVQSGAYLGEDDIERFDDHYGR